MRAGERRDKADTWESIPCLGMVVTVEKIYFKTEVIEAIVRLVVRSSFIKVLEAGRITETHSEDKETCSKHESEVIMKSGKQKKQIWWMELAKR